MTIAHMMTAMTCLLSTCDNATVYTHPNLLRNSAPVSLNTLDAPCMGKLAGLRTQILNLENSQQQHDTHLSDMELQIEKLKQLLPQGNTAAKRQRRHYNEQQIDMKVPRDQGWERHKRSLS